MQGRIYEFRWKDEYSPYFRMYSEGRMIEQPIAFGAQLSMEVIDGTVCMGYEKNGEWNPCPTIEKGVRKCEACKRQEGMPIAQYCDGFNTSMFSGEELETLNAPHYVYFAMFDAGLVKVGVSGSARGYLRQIEQGSHFSLIVADGLWGVPARQMETTIRRAGVVDKIQGSQKKDLVFPHVTPEEGKEELLKLAGQHLPAVLAIYPQFEQHLKNPPEFLEFASYFRLQDAERIQKPLHNPTLEVGEYVSGKVVSVKGPFIVIETDSEKVLLEAKRLKGMKIDFSPKPAGLKKEEAFQSALF